MCSPCRWNGSDGRARRRDNARPPATLETHALSILVWTPPVAGGHGLVGSGRGPPHTVDLGSGRARSGRGRARGVAFGRLCPLDRRDQRGGGEKSRGSPCGEK